MKIISIFATVFALNVYAADEAKVFFIEPKDKAVVQKTFQVKMGSEGVKICEANKESKEPLCGHHHILVDGKAMASGQPVPTDATHLHYGKGQTEATLTLAPGKHKLTLQFADFAHRSYGEKLSSSIEVEVK